MKRPKPNLIAFFAAGLLATSILFVEPARAVLPNPVLTFVGQLSFTKEDKTFVRYQFKVNNKASFPSALFEAAPGLPPCGVNTKSSRTWIDIFDQRGKRLYGFCAFSKPDDLGSIWFALEKDVLPPSSVYIEMNDRQTNTTYKSNLADTSR